MKTTIIDIIKYSMYMRLIIEAHESLLLSSTSEINLLDFPKLSDIVSFFFAWFVLLFSISLPILAFYYFWIKRHKYDPDSKFFFMEFFADIRFSKYARLYMSLMLTRRVVFVLIVIFLSNTNRYFVFPLLISK